MKYLILKTKRLLRDIFKRIPIVLSYSFLVLSGIVCLTILLPRCFNRVPVLSYFICEHELPLTYELCGEVKIIDKDGKLVNKNVEVFVGGYSTFLTSTEFKLKFSAPITERIFVVIRYEKNGKVIESTQSLKIDKECYSIWKEFIINV